MDATNPFVSRMTDEEQSDFGDFLAEFVKKSNEVNNPNDPYKAEYEVVFLIARKPSC